MSKAVGWQFWRQLNHPKHVCAPMVDGSDLPFRMLVRSHNADLCYSPMVNARAFLGTTERKREEWFQTVQEDRPLVVQLCGDDPAVLCAAAEVLQDKVDAVDVNFGCPQAIAKRGPYGAFLLDNPPLIGELISRLVAHLTVPVTAKMRILPQLDDTLHVARVIADAGASVLTVHGRTKEQKKQFSGLADWGAIRAVREALPIPVISNGNIQRFEDIERCLEETGCCGVMSAQGLLENPTLFNPGANLTPCDMALQYLDFVDAFRKPGIRVNLPGHMFWILNRPDHLHTHTDIRQAMSRLGAVSTDAWREQLAQLKARTEGG